MSHDRGCFRCFEDSNIGCNKSYCPYRKEEPEMNLNEDNDFGFSLVSEQELKAHEEMLKKKVEEQSLFVQTTTVEYENKIQGLMAMITPLLNNLQKDPGKEYILWPDRAVKIKAFQKKLEDYIKF
jgi:hypothetical protein